MNAPTQAAPTMQPFEAFPKLTAQIQFMANHLSGISLSEWGEFIAEINTALTTRVPLTAKQSAYESECLTALRKYVDDCVGNPAHIRHIEQALATIDHLKSSGERAEIEAVNESARAKLRSVSPAPAPGEVEELKALIRAYTTNPEFRLQGDGLQYVARQTVSNHAPGLALAILARGYHLPTGEGAEAARIRKLCESHCYSEDHDGLDDDEVDEICQAYLRLHAALHPTPTPTAPKE